MAQGLTFDELEGWAEDDHGEALEVFLKSSPAIEAPDWACVRRAALAATDARSFFETQFQPVLITDDRPSLVTGYYEPELMGAATKTGRFQHPIYALPPEADGATWLSRSEIDDTKMLEGRGLELAWIEHSIDGFLMQVQGSGRIRLTDGSVLRLGYAGRNGHPYRSIGQMLVAEGIFDREAITADRLRNWVLANSSKGAALLRQNPSFVFFKKVIADPDEGPIGTMGIPVTAMRSLAVDASIIPLGAPVWMQKADNFPLCRLMIAQDTGSAIKGAQRADIYFGSGATAGKLAGAVRDPARLVVLLPAAQATALIERGSE